VTPTPEKTPTGGATWAVLALEMLAAAMMMILVNNGVDSFFTATGLAVESCAFNRSVGISLSPPLYHHPPLPPHPSPHTAHRTAPVDRPPSYGH
jgi:hypothetical protein